MPTCIYEKIFCHNFLSKNYFVTSLKEVIKKKRNVVDRIFIKKYVLIYLFYMKDILGQPSYKKFGFLTIFLYDLARISNTDFVWDDLYIRKVVLSQFPIKNCFGQHFYKEVISEHF